MPVPIPVSFRDRIPVLYMYLKYRNSALPQSQADIDIEYLLNIKQYMRFEN